MSMTRARRRRGGREPRCRHSCVLLALCAVPILLACESTRKPPDTIAVSARREGDTARVAGQQPDTVSFVMADSLAPAFQQFARFLSLAVASRVPHAGRVDSVYTSGTDLGIDERDTDMRWVAASRILYVSTKGDTGRAAAVITEVARQVDDHDGYRASYGIREDTAHWGLVRGVDTSGRWLVQGDAAEGFGVFHIGRDIRWVVGSRSQALAAVDSIRRARGLPLVR